MAATTPSPVTVAAGSTVPTASGTTSRQPGVCYVFTAASDPTADNDSGNGYVVGDMWINTVTPKVLVCTSSAAAAAVWTQVS